MLGSGHLISGVDVATGTLALMVFSAGAAVIIVAVLIRAALRRAGNAGLSGALWVGALAILGAAFTYALLDRLAQRDLIAARRAIEAQAVDLSTRALAPGSALGCLDAVANALIENGCEQRLFASPEATAAAIAYVDARFSLLVASATLSEHDPGYRPSFERLRRGLEEDRYGLVAHVLTTRGCNGADCAELRLLHDPARVVANMNAHVFEASLGAHALAWAPNASGAISSSSSSSAPPVVATAPPMATTGTGHDASVAAASAAPVPDKFDFPSARSIPPVNIMNPEPGAPPSPEQRPTALPKRPPVRHQSTRQAAAPAPTRPSAPLPPPPAAQEAPAEAPPAAPAAPARPDPHAAR
jgi:hypothetical protein